MLDKSIPHIGILTGKIRNIIFDMDGTLVNTAMATVPACQEEAERYGLPVKSPTEIKQLIGYADPEFYYRLYPGYAKEDLRKYAVSVGEKENEIIKKFGTNILFPGIIELLNILKQFNFYLSIASTGSIEHVNVCLKAAGILDLFEKIRCNEPEKTEMVKCIIKDGPKGEWMIIGDKNSDLIAGKNNGISTIAARYGFGSEEECSKFDFSIYKPSQLLELLNLSDD